MRLFLFVLCLSSYLLCHASEVLKVSSEVKDKTVEQATGNYLRDGSVYGFARYRLDSPKLTRYLYRSTKGTWSITGSEANIEKSKGTIVSSKAADSPLGQTFKYYSGGSWNVDPSFFVTLLDSSMEESSARVENIEAMSEVDGTAKTSTIPESPDGDSKEIESEAKERENIPADHVVSHETGADSALLDTTEAESKDSEAAGTLSTQEVAPNTAPSEDSSEGQAIPVAGDEDGKVSVDTLRSEDVPSVDSEQKGSIPMKEDIPVVQEPLPIEKRTETVAVEVIQSEAGSGDIIDSSLSADIKPTEKLKPSTAEKKKVSKSDMNKPKTGTGADDAIPLQQPMLDGEKSTKSKKTEKVQSESYGDVPLEYVIGAVALVVVAVIAAVLVKSTSQTQNTPTVSSDDTVKSAESIANVATASLNGTDRGQAKVKHHQAAVVQSKQKLEDNINKDSLKVAHSREGGVVVDDDVAVATDDIQNVSVDVTQFKEGGVVVGDEVTIATDDIQNVSVKVAQTEEGDVVVGDEVTIATDDIQNDSVKVAQFGEGGVVVGDVAVGIDDIQNVSVKVAQTEEGDVVIGDEVAVATHDIQNDSVKAAQSEEESVIVSEVTIATDEIQNDSAKVAQSEEVQEKGPLSNDVVAATDDQIEDNEYPDNVNLSNAIGQIQNSTGDSVVESETNDVAQEEEDVVQDPIAERRLALEALQCLSLRYRQVVTHDALNTDEAMTSPPPRSVTRRTSVFISESMKGTRSDRMKKMDAKWLASVSTEEGGSDEDEIDQNNEALGLEFMVPKFQLLVQLLDKDDGFVEEFVEQEGLVMLSQSLSFVVDEALAEGTFASRGRRSSVDSPSIEQRRFSCTSPVSPLAGAITAVMTPSGVELQALILKATASVLKSSIGLEWALSNVEALSSIFISVQKSGQREDMGQAYKLLTDLCFREDEFKTSSRRMLVEVLERLGELDGTRPRYDAVCRLLLDKLSSWRTKYQV
jgi:hypothetical protein